MSQVTLQTPIGTALPSFSRTITSAVIRSRQWAGTNPIHVDESVAKAQGFERPIATGHIASAYMQDACVRFFGEHYFCDASVDVRFIRPFYLNGRREDQGCAEGSWGRSLHRRPVVHEPAGRASRHRASHSARQPAVKAGPTAMPAGRDGQPRCCRGMCERIVAGV